MKKILISVLIILLLILSYFALAKGIGFLKIKSINDIKSASTKLQNDFNEANELSSKIYPTELETLENAIKQLKISKQEYDNKNLYATEENSIGTIELKTYKIHYLWTVLGNYRKDRGVRSLTLDLKSTETKDVYDLEFTLIGSYTRITDFLYDIENDDQLNFGIENYYVEPYTIERTTVTTIIEGNDRYKKTEVTSPYNKITEITDSPTIIQTTETETTETTETETTKPEEKQENNNEDKVIIYDPRWVQATFTVKDIGVTLD